MAEPAEDSPDPGYEFAWTEGLGDVVVAAEFESLDAVGLGSV